VRYWDCEDHTVYSNDLEDGQPSIGSPIVRVLDSWDLYYCSDDSQRKVNHVTLALKEVSPIDNKPDDDFDH
jgi:hypothetical protein